MNERRDLRTEKTRNLPQLLRAAERRVNAHVFRREGDDALASIPANKDRDVDLLLLEAADLIEQWDVLSLVALSKERDQLRAIARDVSTMDCFHTGGKCPAGCECLSARAEAALSGVPIAIETDPVLFYGPEHYVLSNFSAFRVRVLVDDGEGGELLCTFDTSEAAYHWFKFPGAPEIQARIRAAMSAHDAFKLAERYRDRRRPDWDAVKVETMRQILRAKVDQHEYVRRKLLETGDRQLIEDSWRDDFWGWGPNRDGQNMLGKLWMEVRAELRTKPTGG